MKKNLLVLLSVLFLMTGCSSKPAVRDHLMINVSGVNGEGVLDYNIDYDALVEDVLDIKLESFMDIFSEEAKQYGDFINTVFVNPSKTDGLKNGDKIKFEIEVGDEYKKMVSKKSLTYKVSGLE